MTSQARRVCFTLQVQPARLEEYRTRHREVWPEMLQALAATGWDDYSLFLREDGLLVGFLVTEDFDAAKAAMEATDVNRRWQAEMAPYFVGLVTDDLTPRRSRYARSSTFATHWRASPVTRWLEALAARQRPRKPV
jgi:L-rhamnose mutarotase